MSVFAETAATFGLGLNIINVGCYFRKRLVPSRIIKRAERKVSSLESEIMMGQLIERDPAEAEHVQTVRIGAEVALQAAKNLTAGSDFRKIRLQLVTCWAAYDECRQYKKELEKRSAAAQRAYNDKRLANSLKSSNPTSCLSIHTGAIEKGSDLKSNSQPLVAAELTMEECGEVSSGQVGMLSAQVDDRTIESVKQGNAFLVAEVWEQEDQNDGNTNILNFITPSPNVASENLASIPISIQESSNTINVDYSLLMNEILPMIHA